MTTEEKQYDGSVSLVINNRIINESRCPSLSWFWDNIEEEQRILFAEPDGSFFPIPAEHIVQLDGPVNFRAQQRVFKKFEGTDLNTMVNMWAEIEDRPHEEVYEIIKNGRIRLSLILNSMGGSTKIAKEIKTIAEKVREQGGTVYSYARYADSAAADIFMTADSGQRYLLPYSQIMFHTSMETPRKYLGEEKPSKTVERYKEEEWPAMEKMILDNVKVEQRERVVAILEKAKKRKQGEFNLHAMQAEEIGIAKIPRHTDGTFKSLEQQFLEDHGMEQAEIQGTRISEFFKMAHSGRWNKNLSDSRFLNILNRIFRMLRYE